MQARRRARPVAKVPLEEPDDNSPGAARTRDFLRAVLRAEKARRNLTYPQLSRMLHDYGIEQSATNLGSKFHRGMMSAHLFLALLAVMGVGSLELEEIAIARKGM